MFRVKFMIKFIKSTDNYVFILYYRTDKMFNLSYLKMFNQTLFRIIYHLQ